MDYETTINRAPPEDAYEPTDQDLINMFVKNQIEIWGYEQVEVWFDTGFNLKVINGKVLWVK